MFPTFTQHLLDRMLDGMLGTSTSLEVAKNVRNLLDAGWNKFKLVQTLMEHRSNNSRNKCWTDVGQMLEAFKWPLDMKQQNTYGKYHTTIYLQKPNRTLLKSVRVRPGTDLLLHQYSLHLSGRTTCDNCKGFLPCLERIVGGKFVPTNCKRDSSKTAKAISVLHVSVFSEVN